MYKVFFNQRPLILTTKPPEITDTTLVLPIKYTEAKNLISALKSKRYQSIYAYHPKVDKLWKHFYQKFGLIEAAGGLVKHQNGKTLMIFRNGKWDLPKGRIEKNEIILDAALREVREETGVLDLTIVKPIQETLHIFKRNHKYKLKKTYWYLMHSNCSRPLVPQSLEGIEKAVWLTNDEVKVCLQNAYANIKVHF
jgi:8-oxo-dGTP pyrophosphatase MutT (NUDIX family)